MENKDLEEFLRLQNTKKNIRWHKKIDILLAVATCSIGLESIPHYFGLDLKGFTIAWFIMPPIIFISLIINIRKYLSGDVIKWNVFFLFPLILYALSVNWNEDIPFGKVPETLRSFSLSLIILSFYIVHGRTAKGRYTFVMALILIGGIAAILNIASLIGLSDKGIMVYHLGNNVYITRISPLGDPNITTIYFLGFAVSLPFWQNLIGKSKGFIIGTLSFILVLFAISGSASRGGSIAIVFSALVMYYFLWVKAKRSKILVLFLLVLLFVLLFVDIKNPVLPKQFNTLIDRFSLLAVEGINEVNAYTRLVSILWLIEDIFTGPQLVGIGFEQFAQYTTPRGGVWLPHNSFVDLYVIGGMFGFFAFIGLWWVALRAQFRNINVKNEYMKFYSTWYISYGAGLLLLAFSVSIAWTKIIWAYLGIGVALSKINKDASNLNRKT